MCKTNFIKKSGNNKEKIGISLTIVLTVFDRLQHDEKPRENTPSQRPDGDLPRVSYVAWHSTNRRSRPWSTILKSLLQVDASEYGPSVTLLQPAAHSANSTDILWQPVAYRSSSLSPTGQRHAQIEKETPAIVHAFHKLDQLLFGNADVVVHSDHKPLEIIFKRPACWRTTTPPKHDAYSV